MLSDRAEFLAAVSRALSLDVADHPPAMLSLNIDRFEVIVDSLGRDAGGHALDVIGGRLQTCLRPGDVLGRWHGDEFAILLAAPCRREDASILAEHIAEALRNPVTLGRHQVTLTASIGIALAEPGSDASTLLRKANLAMCEAKDAGRARYRVFSSATREQAWQRMCLETDLRQALARNEFLAHYQPMVDLSSGEIVGAEALVRWQHPERGAVPPSLFIPVAEESGLIVPIGALVLEAACNEASSNWRPLSIVSVNLSARQLEQPDALTASIHAALDATGLDPSRLKLEITESAVMHDPELAIATLWAVKGLGVQLAIDDFGTGYSSLAYLKRFPVETIKIDRSFVDGVVYQPEDQAIVGATVAFARALDMTVVAEGIETEDQAAVLKELGCHLGQGYLWGKPGPPMSLALRQPIALAA
jgi:diguanylate cyclase (GGDEF)-like protein